MDIEQVFALAKKAIEEGKTMGQFLRELPNSDQLSPLELQEYSKAYDQLRRTR